MSDASVLAARSAGLRHVSDVRPGITRARRGRSFQYRDPKGKVVRDTKSLARIRSLVIPPAWTDVWICPIENGHLQATGRDIRGRKQYRYHTDWRATRDETKFHRMIAFGRALPRIRRRVSQDLRLNGLPREKVLATVVRLLETTLIRVGNDEYARENGSFGLTTMRDRHVRIRRGEVTFTFPGKSGRRHVIDVRNPTLARIVRQCRDLPGYELFQYLDEAGERVDVTSTEVNAYLKEISGEDFTAKDFRTWAGTVLAATALKEFEKFSSQTEAKRNVVAAIEAVSRLLGNTPAVCRKCYIHPVIFETYLDGSLVDRLRERAEKAIARDLKNLRADEAAVLVLIHKKLER